MRIIFTSKRNGMNVIATHLLDSEYKKDKKALTVVYIHQKKTVAQP